MKNMIPALARRIEERWGAWRAEFCRASELR
jgi:hypothetical protein